MSQARTTGQEPHYEILICTYLTSQQGRNQDERDQVASKGVAGLHSIRCSKLAWLVYDTVRQFIVWYAVVGGHQDALHFIPAFDGSFAQAPAGDNLSAGAC